MAPMVDWNRILHISKNERINFQVSVLGRRWSLLFLRGWCFGVADADRLKDERWVISPRMQNGLDTLKEVLVDGEFRS